MTCCCEEEGTGKRNQHMRQTFSLIQYSEHGREEEQTATFLINDDGFSGMAL